MGKKIWIIDSEWEGYAIETKAIKDEFPDAEIRFSGSADYKEKIEVYAKDADAVICQIDIEMKEEFINKLDNCRIISVYGVGYNNVNVKAAGAKGITVANVPDYCTEDVSDYVIAAIYHCNKTLFRYAEEVKTSSWGAMAARNLIKRIRNSTLLIAGFGRIGQAVAEKALAMNMKVLCYDPYVSEERAAELGVGKVDMDEGLAIADYVSLNMKLDASTQNFMDYEKISKMKSTAYLINASRGGVIAEADLIKAVRNKVIAGACLDVLAEEPPARDNPIIHTENIFVTPHISYLTQSSLDDLQRLAAENAICSLKGGKVMTAVN